MTKEFVTHVADEQADGPEQSLRLVADAAAEKQAAIRMRINLQLWHPIDRQYVSWKGQIWKLEVQTVEEAKAVQRSLEAFFDLMADCQPEGTATVLEDVLRLRREARRLAQEGDHRNDLPIADHRTAPVGAAPEGSPDVPGEPGEPGEPGDPGAPGAEPDIPTELLKAV